MLKAHIRQQIRKAESPAEKADDKPHELSNIHVQEVSLVDRAANRRTLLVVKRDRKRVKAAEPQDDGPIVDLAAQPKGDLPGAELDRADAEKKAAKSADPEKPPEEDSSEKGPASEGEKKEEAADKAPPEAKVDDKPEGRPAGETVPVKEEITVKEDGQPAEVEKVGRPMARARLDKLKAAMKVLSDLLGEVDVDESAGAEKSATQEPAAENQQIKDLQGVVESLKGELQTQTKLVQSLQQMVAEQGETLAKSRQTPRSNAISLEKAVDGHANVSWPADLAEQRPRGRHF